MIRYSLLCGHDHTFESWFRDSGAFDSLAAGRQIGCPACGDTDVRKALMMPSVVTARAKPRPAPVPAEPSPAPPTSPEVPPQPLALLDERERKLRDAMRALHREIVSQSDNVGRAFAEEARRIHEGDAPARSIYGEATRDQVTALLDDGIALLPMPALPDDHN